MNNQETSKPSLIEIQKLSKNEIFTMVQEVVKAISDNDDKKLSDLYSILLPMARCVVENIQDDPAFAECYQKVYNAAVITTLQELCHINLRNQKQYQQFEQALSNHKDIVNFIYDQKLCSYIDLFMKFKCPFQIIYELEKNGVIVMQGVNDRTYYGLSLDFINFYKNKTSKN